MLEPGACTLYSGAANGAESEFGRQAEHYGVAEVNYSFEGHKDERSRGLRVLEEAELQRGDVSLTYVSRLMNRRYPDTPLFKKVLQSIFYQVNSGQQIFVIGLIQEDGTVKGGTGWGAEFAKLCNKPLHVFDQAQARWYRWIEEDWKPDSAPVITEAEFTGTGTRFLDARGKNAIEGLFERSFEG